MQYEHTNQKSKPKPKSKQTMKRQKTIQHDSSVPKRNTEDLLYVLDLETSGLGERLGDDVVLEIAIYELNIKTLVDKPVFKSCIYYPKTRITGHEWIFHNSDLTIEDIQHGQALKYVVKRTREILSGNKWTSFNTSFDYDRFLRNEPWKIITKPIYCLMLKSTDLCQIPRYYNRDYDNGDYKWPKLTEAYRILVNKHDHSNHETHRAENDTVLAVEVAKALIRYERNTTYLKQLSQSVIDAPLLHITHSEYDPPQELEVWLHEYHNGFGNDYITVYDANESEATGTQDINILHIANLLDK